MPEVSNYSFELQEVTELLVKAAGVRDGFWMLNVNLSLTGGNFQNTPDSALPGSIVLIQSLGISKADPATSPANMTVDASKVNGKTRK